MSSANLIRLYSDTSLLISAIIIRNSKWCTTKHWGISTNSTWEPYKMKLICEEIIRPYSKIPSISKCFQFMKKNDMVYLFKCLRKIKLHHVHGTTTIKHVHDIIKTFNKADRQDRPLLNPCYVLFRQPFLSIKEDTCFPIILSNTLLRPRNTLKKLISNKNILIHNSIYFSQNLACLVTNAVFGARSSCVKRCTEDSKCV